MRMLVWDRSLGSFLMDFSGDVDGILTSAIKAVDDQIVAMVGIPSRKRNQCLRHHLRPPLFCLRGGLEPADLGSSGAEAARLRALINVDEEATRAFKRLSEKISRDDAALAKLDREIATASQAEARSRN
jgi:hypothetical protein